MPRPLSTSSVLPHLVNHLGTAATVLFGLLTALKVLTVAHFSTVTAYAITRDMGTSSILITALFTGWPILLLFAITGWLIWSEGDGPPRPSPPQWAAIAVTCIALVPALFVVLAAAAGAFLYLGRRVGRLKRQEESPLPLLVTLYLLSCLQFINGDVWIPAQRPCFPLRARQTTV